MDNMPDNMVQACRQSEEALQGRGEEDQVSILRDFIFL